MLCALHVLYICNATCIGYNKVYRSLTQPSRNYTHRSAIRDEKNVGWFEPVIPWYDATHGKE